MAGICQVTGKGQMHGNLVSHSNRKTKRVWRPNIHKKRFWLESEGRWVALTVSAAGIREINKRGIDAVVRDMRARGTKV